MSDLSMTPAEREAFLADVHVGILAMHRGAVHEVGAPGADGRECRVLLLDRVEDATERTRVGHNDGRADSRPGRREQVHLDARHVSRRSRSSGDRAG